MKLRTWAELSSDELKRRRAAFRVILLVQATGLVIGGVASLVALLVSPTTADLRTVFPPFVLAGACWLVYRWSERHWYPAVHLYLLFSLIFNVFGMYGLGGAQGPMMAFSAVIVLTAAMLVDMRAGMEWTILCLIGYGIYAVGVPLGWIKLPMDTFESTKVYVFPTFFTLSFVALSLLILLFGNSLNQALDRARELASSLEHEAKQRATAGLQLESTNRQLQELAEYNERRVAELQALQQISVRINTQLETSELMHLICEQSVALADAEAGGVYIYDSQRDVLTLSVAVGYYTEYLGSTLKPGEGLAGQAFAGRRTMAVEDYRTWAGQSAVYEADPRIKAVLAVPLLSKASILGVLDIGGGERKQVFDERDSALVELFAAQAAVALENARLFQQTQTALKELESTNRRLVQQGWQGFLERKAATRRTEVGTLIAASSETPVEPLSIPLELRGQPLGKLTVQRQAGRAWTQDEIDMLQTIALQTALAADNARLVEQTRLALQETEGLFAAARTLAGAAQIQDICQSLAEFVNQLLQAERTIVTLVDSPHKQLVARVGSGHLEGQIEMTFDEYDAGIAGQVVRSGKPALSHTAEDQSESEQTRQRRQQHGLGSLIVAPLGIKGQTIGTVAVANRTFQRRFAQHDVEVVMALAGPASTALENVRLLEATQRRAERERLIRQITTRIRSASDTQGILETTASELAQSLRVPRAIVRLAMDEKRKE